MRVGIDTYSYHRLLGWVRPEEDDPGWRLADGGPAAMAQAHALGCDVVSLETCFLGPPAELDYGTLAEAAGALDLSLAWGHPEGLAFGRDAAALPDLLDWIDVAEALGSRLMRIVVAGPRLRGLEPVERQIDTTLEPLRRAAAHAGERGLHLAIENHADLDSQELAALIDRAGAPNVGVCLDTANTARVGEEADVAARRLADRVLMVHLKDVEQVTGPDDLVAGTCSVTYGQGSVPLNAVLEELAVPIARGAPVCVEIGRVRPGDDELALVEASVGWLREHAG
jgi:sugar phosphate isomerase/epimerase